jgi:hypothetical protein
MKEPILEYLQTAEPEPKKIYSEKLENDSGFDMKKLSHDRKSTMHEWSTKAKGVNMDKLEKRTQ